MEYAAYCIAAFKSLRTAKTDVRAMAHINNGKAYNLLKFTRSTGNWYLFPRRRSTSFYVSVPWPASTDRYFGVCQKQTAKRDGVVRGASATPIKVLYQKLKPSQRMASPQSEGRCLGYAGVERRASLRGACVACRGHLRLTEEGIVPPQLHSRIYGS
jgi:hypothetical protein